MAIIGNPLVSTNFQTDTFNGDGSTVAFTLSIAPASPASVAVYISGLYQVPVSAYTISGTTLTFTGAPPTGTGNILVLHLGVQSQTLVPVNGSITPPMLNNANVIYWSTSNNNVGIGNTTPTDRLTVGGNIVPGSNNSFDLGTSAQVWRHIYMGDLNMSNEGHEVGNEVDGTKGKWTIQEGADNLYLINRNTGKKYILNIKEVE